jgi:translation initiation factor 1A
MAVNKPTGGHKPAYFNKQQRTAEQDPNALKKIRTPFRKELEMYGKVIQLMGSNQVKIACEDGKDRICRIPGKLFKHVWLKANDIVIIRLWDFQPTKADVIWRYQGFQKNALEKRGELTKLYEYTHDEVTNYQETPTHQKPLEEEQEEPEDEETFDDEENIDDEDEDYD